jgi:hypothetical protein
MQGLTVRHYEIIVKVRARARRDLLWLVACPTGDI